LNKKLLLRIVSVTLDMNSKLLI